MRAVVRSILAELLRRHRGSGRVHLNDIAEVIDARAVTYEEVEVLITRLESEGLEVGEPLSALEVDVLRAVLASARKLQASLRRKPTVQEIAKDSGYPAFTVRRSLENGRRTAEPRARG